MSIQQQATSAKGGPASGGSNKQHSRTVACGMWHVAGFSLIELVISLSILAIGLVGAMRVFPVGLRASQRAEMNSRAAFTAQRVIESLKLTPWGDLKEEETTTEEDGFDVTTRIEPLALDPLVDATRLRAVHITVRPKQATVRARALTFMTYVRRESS